MKNILFVSDVKNWAFDITYQGINKYLKSDLYYTSDEPRITRDIIKQYDAVHFFNWLGAQEFAGMDNVSAGVCQWNHRIKWGDISPKYIGRLKKVVAISRMLEDDVKKLNPNTFYIPNAVDPDLFKAVEKEPEDEFVVSWVSQKTSGGFGEEKTGEGRKRWDIKGYGLILQPLVERLKDQVTFKICSNDYSNAVPHEEMPRFYEDADCHICTSLYEGGPFSVLEAAACGKAVVSTKVGIVPELIQGDFIIDPPHCRDDLPAVIDKFVEYILYLKENRELCTLIGTLNRKEVEKAWTWEHVSKLWEELLCQKS